MTVWPLRFRDMLNGTMLFTDDAGGYFSADRSFLERYVHGASTNEDLELLVRTGSAFESTDQLAFQSFLSRWVNRISHSPTIRYVMLVPTLRCNLACNYCQVSRTSEKAKGFDWTEATLCAVLDWLKSLETDQIKIEFQGGEPLLRLDLLSAVREFCRTRFKKAEFIVCTNLQRVSCEAWDFFDSADTFISTSYDGTPEHHQAQRTVTTEATEAFFQNLKHAVDRYGPEKVSVLPTIDPDNPPDPTELIQSYVSLGLNSIFLRRVNHQGFARKRYRAETSAAWIVYVRKFIYALIDYNASSENPVEEFYLAHLVRRIAQGGNNGHADLRNPNWLGLDYLVIDYDGAFYPTDEARMVSRVGLVDLSVGSVLSEIDQEKLRLLNSEATNFSDPDCQHCTYQPYCGVDRVDEIARHGRVDLPRARTEFCQLHLALFDFAFELLYSPDENVKRTLAKWLRVPAFSPMFALRAE